jgi:hypothetical protein
VRGLVFVREEKSGHVVGGKAGIRVLFVRQARGLRPRHHDTAETKRLHGGDADAGRLHRDQKATRE